MKGFETHELSKQVNWTLQFAESAWRELQKRVGKLQIYTKISSQGIQKSETKAKAEGNIPILEEDEIRNKDGNQQTKENNFSMDRSENQHGKQYMELKADLDELKIKYEKIQGEINKVNEDFYKLKGSFDNEDKVNREPTSISKEYKKLSEQLREQISNFEGKFYTQIQESTTKLRQQLKAEVSTEVERLESQKKEVDEWLQKVLFSLMQAEKFCAHKLKEISFLMKSEEIQSILAKEKKNHEEKVAEDQERLEKIQAIIAQSPEVLVDQISADAKCFLVQKSMITKQSGDWQSKMVLLDVQVGEKVFCFRTHIHAYKGYITLGVTDRVSLKENNSAQREYSFEYEGDGIILYGVGEEKEHKQATDDPLRKDTIVYVEVDKTNCTVTFTLQDSNRGMREYKVKSPILSQPNRQFVPFYTMYNLGDCISWDIE